MKTSSGYGGISGPSLASMAPPRDDDDVSHLIRRRKPTQTPSDNPVIEPYRCSGNPPTLSPPKSGDPGRPDLSNQETPFKTTQELPVSSEVQK